MLKIKELIYKTVLSLALKRPSPDRISRSGEEGERVNCYTIMIIDSDDKPDVLLKKKDGDALLGYEWTGERFDREVELTLSEVVKRSSLGQLRIIHYYGLTDIKFNSVYDFSLNKLTGYVYLTVHARRFFSRLRLLQFKRSKLVKRKRIEVLEFMINEHLEKGTKDFSSYSLMSGIYTKQWFYHPRRHLLRNAIQLHLDSFVLSGDMVKQGSKYYLTGSAVNSLERYHDETQRHDEILKAQKGIGRLTIILIIASLSQTGFIKLPEMLDFRSMDFKWLYEEPTEEQQPELYAPEPNEHTEGSS